jgi:hypothetical protein
LWRPVVGGLASGFAEVRDRWTLVDLAEAIAVLDYREAADREVERRREKRKPKRGRNG